MRAYGSGIRRGPMAADHFTQIANGLFRDPALSFKAKGIFGLISTHTNGWKVSVAELARHGREGIDAVTSGLKELEHHGYLVRERIRRADGTLGESVYAITDMPAERQQDSQRRRSPPERGNPPQGEPAQAQRRTKNTRSKKTTYQNTTPSVPSVVHAHTRESDTRSTDAPAPRTDPAPLTPGARLLLAVGAEHPELLLTGQALEDQGHVATRLLDAGWTTPQLRHVIADRPLPRPIRTTVAAIVAARLRAAEVTIPPSHASELPTPHAPTGRPVLEALTYRALVECTGCGKPGTAPGEDLCPACLQWPVCTSCTGPTPRRAHPAADGRCTVCASHDRTTP
ncbi:hypothetical protein [Streptomyces sp. NPDC058595]|uniref:hypothetical protein n=1 Tax=Streptomyces sp. NPDC058595 TaxID=3346550 RepID=UPI0036471780